MDRHRNLATRGDAATIRSVVPEAERPNDHLRRLDAEGPQPQRAGGTSLRPAGPAKLPALAADFVELVAPARVAKQSDGRAPRFGARECPFLQHPCVRPLTFLIGHRPLFLLRLPRNRFLAHSRHFVLHR